MSKRILAFIVSLSLLWTTNAATAQFDVAAAHKELINILTNFIRIDTSVTATKGAEYLKTFLDREGIASEILHLEPDHGNLVARIKGNGSKRPLLLMGHTDVVGVEREKWTVDPFGGIIKDGFIYGRGAQDDKSMTAANLIIFLTLHRLKTPLDRDVIFLAEAGEEGAPYLGINFLVKQHWDKIDCEFAINEGGSIVQRDGKVNLVRVATAEKVPNPIMLTSKGVSGHGSKPRPDNAIVHLAKAIAKFDSWQPPMRLNETTREYFKRLAQVSSLEKASLFRNLENPEVQEQLRLHDFTHNAMLRTTVSANMIRGGFRQNVIPGDASATLDVRALPDEDLKSFTNLLAQVINDPAITITPLGASRAPTPPVPLDTELFLAFERAQKRLFPDAITVPMMTTGATDSAQLRAKGVKAYGINVIADEADSALMHGNDERVSVEALRGFLEYLWLVVTDVAASKK
jgi:acetylornithine deacetylase/succinyl-diaminopimelate desuccinylase-like protein